MRKHYDEFDARYLNLLTDFGFHKIFGTESNKDLLRDFLNQIIKEEGPITDIKILPPEQWGNLENERKAVFDIFCKTDGGEYFIVEMQKAQQPFFFDRSIFYASMAIQKQVPKGLWNYRLHKVYLVAILDFVLFDKLEKGKDFVVERIQLVRENTNTAYSGILKFAFVELPKFRKREEELRTNFDKWVYILKNLPNLKDRPDSIRGEIFDKLFELSEVKQLTKKDMGKYKKSISEYYDVRLCMDFAAEEAREETREEERNAIIKKFFQKNVAIEDIIFFTGYTEDQILRLKNKL